MLTFRLNGETIVMDQPSDIPPAHASALELLRERLCMTGTKEGCASGDCGACTIAVRNPTIGAEWQSVNACIMPAGQLHGLDVATVEGLASGSELHPVQAAMVNHHASQCGFCTPGFVMSLFSLYHADSAITDQSISHALGGNLCRCTGYRPIREAALQMRATEGHIAPWITAQAPLPRLTTSAQNDASPESVRGFYQPTCIAQLSALLEHLEQPRFIAGGTDLMLESTQRLKDFDHLVDLSQVDELRTVNEDADTVTIGAAVTYHQLAPLLERCFPDFGLLLYRLGSQQVRYRGTLGGNIANASPIGDTPPVLLALEAQLELLGPEGVRTLALEDFFIDYRQTALRAREIISRIRINTLAPHQQLKVWKLSKRRDDDISASLLAIRFTLDGEILRDVRVALGGMAAIPKRAYQSEAVLEGQPLTAAQVEKVRSALADEFSPLTDARASSHYRLAATANLFERLRLQLSSTDIATELLDATAD
ncbi:Xanthine dehydrogenase [Carnimonas sp. R-84981]|uniref:xanthine dehydrogenase small subunit n=1 Tax=Carnimonas bestiolae TaxID=3402172 RepID=UPI003EDCAE30